MTLLLLFSDQVAPSASGDAVAGFLIETEPGVWYDGTADLISGNTRRGRQQELDQYQAGVAEVLLDNDDRKYDPTYAASPLNGYIAPMAGIQLRSTYGGITYPIFTGYADRWTQNRDGPHRGTTNLTATDGFKVLARAGLASSVYAQEVLADAPTRWWRLGEPAGTPALFDQVGQQHMPVTGTLGGEEGLIDREADGAVAFSAGNYATAPGTTLPTGSAVTVEFWIKVAAGSGELVMEYVDPGSGSDAEFQISTGDGSVIAVLFGDVDMTGLVNLAAGTRYHFVFVATFGQAATIYMDGTESVNPASANRIWTTPLRSVPFRVNKDTVGLTEDFVLDEFAIYDHALAVDRIVAHNAAGRTPWDGDSVAQRFDRVLDAVAWPEGLRNIDAGNTTLVGADLATSALEHLQKVADSDFGNLYVTAHGVLRFEGRDALPNQTAVAAFSDTAGTDLPITYSAPELSEDLIRNDVTVSRTEGAAQNVRDETSIGRYGPITYTRDGLLGDSDAFSRAAAEFLVSEYGTPFERVNSMVVNPYRDPANLWPAILALELTDWVTLEETPQHVSPAWTRTLAVEGISHTFGPKAWEATFDLSPAFGTGDGTDCVLELDTGPCGLGDARLWF